MMAAREGFGNVLADSTRAVERGHYPPEALKYRIAVKGLGQSDPHDARILKAFALGLAVATRGMDHLRNRATLEINARINDNPAFKAELYGGPVSAEPTSYADKERAVRACENIYAVGDSVGMCRFTTKLFNSPSLPGLEEFRTQLANVTGLRVHRRRARAVRPQRDGRRAADQHRLGVRRKDDTLPDRWFDEPNPGGPYKGERIDRQEFDAMLSRFYEISRLTSEGRAAGIVAQGTRRGTGCVMAVTVNFPGVVLSTGRPVDDRPRIGVEGRPVDPGARSAGARHGAKSSTIRSTTSPSTRKSSCTASIRGRSRTATSSRSSPAWPGIGLGCQAEVHRVRKTNVRVRVWLARLERTSVARTVMPRSPARRSTSTT